VAALDHLEASGFLQVVRPSGIYRTAPVGNVEQDHFLNAVVQVRTSLTHRGLLGLLLETEQVFGRVRDVKWGPRTLDLDLLLYENVVESMPGLEVPHPAMCDRGFVLVPLAEVAPELRHPVSGRTMREHAAAWRARTENHGEQVAPVPGPDGRLRSA
jgi:2-amino-4-hydroxy-6-hydroxymethyldihydropteridine diphosphokinase